MLLFFTMPLDETSQLNRGRLFLVDETKGIVGRWIATSSTADKQGVKDWNIRGGVIPATHELSPPLPFYSVTVNPVDLRNVKGVDGNGYPITPFEVKTLDGGTRSDLLIHKDANVPGSMGCIVLPESEFTDFEKVFQEHCKEQNTVKLLVGYTY
ncbi:MAG: hypothetical protein KME60_23915 [Cyanomargarita calcarea GSE-NOS-MK-12-04C]|jgi:hypothetical protein|uniref:Uncharacterized protein n=1 Tax=Cyanomargarita calcarea GSE-NOS-MK-12-04C TaxID=2839659 RepID=A0A951UU57_9CYAN|nr:hypothetical protein [Cyanomargarita calcarea GSE-NOS-MK-12-04C]